MQDAQEASRSYAGAECTLHPLMSTFNADLRGLPPILLHVGSIELFRDGVLRLAGRARRDGVEVTLEEWPEMCHAWAAFPGEFPEADDALRRAAEFIRQQLAE
jgi:acetyl esterase/lipase